MAQRAPSSTPVGLLTPAEVAVRLRISLRKLWRLVSARELPPPVHVGRRGTRWREADIVRYIESLSEQ
jgi:excisionase family DNA binding protein